MLRQRKTGCLLTYDGSEDHWVQPQGLKRYKPPPPGTWEEEWEKPSKEVDETDEDEEDEDADEWD